MKTAEEIIRENFGGNDDSIKRMVSILRIYAKEVAENTLKDAAENQSHNEVKSRILSTKILTP